MTMAPPLSPRETRRSGRRSAPSVSTSNSKSPDSDPPQRPPSSTTGNRNNKRLKQEDTDDVAPASTNTSSNSNGRSKRKPKEKSRQPPSDDPPEVPDVVPEQSASVAPGDEEEEQGVTRCVCGSTGEDDPDTGEFMVQCETCKVWQHGFCMGFESEDQLHDDDYYCEQCRPELHTDLLKKLKRARQSSANSHHTAAPTSTRLSRSHSPSYSTKQPSKRRNTMNSRDAAFDENLKEILDYSAAEAGTIPDVKSSTPNGHVPNLLPETEESLETAPANRKKRKRADNDATSVKKRTRSMSTTSDQATAPIQQPPREETPNPAKTAAPPATNQKTTAKNKRGGGGRKSIAANQDTAAVEGDGTPVPPTKRQGNGGRSKANGAKRPPHSTVAAGAGSHDPNLRRGQGNGTGGQNQGSTTAENSRAHRNTHAYVVSQQPLFTSWGLPDYLAHLENMLPTQIPQPLEVVSSITGRGESIERTTERGVRVKWPSKRMSVVDMNKRVRALVEWVGREQASASDRARRREALEKALRENSALIRQSEVPGGNSSRDVDSMTVDPLPPAQSSSTETPSFSSGSETATLMKDVEALMTDLITFQERFGPGAKSRDRERRHAS
ncbi:histone deacetylase complex subunit cti6 [Moniliophthora roreri]|uniref:PHD-type domain-containing protein n=1 Tax=Moniliophthora roreri TaxID=221103 RepID=A0A0W0FGY8_MONRR|nr:histone deacetylase complex subunit cti6 [Moniliophthora roreri]